jgi:hypothetical protein
MPGQSVYSFMPDQSVNLRSQIRSVMHICQVI